MHLTLVSLLVTSGHWGKIIRFVYFIALIVELQMSHMLYQINFITTMSACVAKLVRIRCLVFYFFLAFGGQFAIRVKMHRLRALIGDAYFGFEDVYVYIW